MAGFSFYWHDYETFGADPSRDRPCQFAGIRTDRDLNETGKPLEIFCKPAPDFLPHPEACLITGITPQIARQKGVIEAEFIARIYAELAQAGTCGVGYNSIRFDDELTRYTLYRNFYEPYGREWQNGNSRWDLIDVMRLAHALRPEGLEWPSGDDGNPSFQLGKLTAANDIKHSHAHDALADVRATIELAKLLRKHQPKLFEYALSLRQKKTVADMIDIDQATPLLHVSSRYPASRGCCALVVPIAWHRSNRNAVICADLSQDPAYWQDREIDDIRRLIYSPKGALAEGEVRIAVKQLHINRSPMVAAAKMLDEALAARLGIALEECRANWRRWKTIDNNAKSKLLDALETNYAADTDVDHALYGGFIPEGDKSLLVQVRKATPEQLRTASLPFTDPRLPELLFRYRARNWPGSLNAEEQARWQQFCRQRISDPQAGGNLVLADYLRELRRLHEQDSEEEHSVVLTALEHYADELLTLSEQSTIEK